MTKPITTLYPASFSRPPRVVDKAEVRRVGPNGTGHLCATCGATTYGLSDACGRCGSRVR